MEVGRGRHPVHRPAAGRRRGPPGRRAGRASFSLNTTIGIRAQSKPRPCRQRSANSGAAAGRYRSVPSGSTTQPCTATGSDVTAPSTSPRRSRSGGVGLVLHVQPQRDPVPLGHGAEHVAEPGVERVRVDRDRQLDRAASGGVERVGRLVVQQAGLPGQPQQPLPRGRGRARAGPAHQHLAGHRLQRPDPLADRARRHVQRAAPPRRTCRARRSPPARPAGRGAASCEAMLMVSQNLSLDCIRADTLTSDRDRLRRRRPAHRLVPHRGDRGAERLRAAPGPGPAVRRRRGRDLRRSPTSS